MDYNRVANLVRGQEGGLMKFIDYQRYRDNNKEFLRGDMWEFKMVNAPKIVYYPGDDLINTRLNSVQVGIDYSTTGIEKRMRGGFTISQRTSQNTSGTLTLQFVDREDTAITYWVTDWRNRISDMDTRYSFRKADLVADCKLVITNSSRVAVKTLEFYNCLYQDAPINENGEEASETDRADVTLTMSFEHYHRIEHNL
jgi:hypothetical protein